MTLEQGGTSLVDHLCYFYIVFVMLLRLLIAALWSPAGKGLTSLLSFVVLNCAVVTFPFGILGQVYRFQIFAPFLLSYCTHSTTYIGCSGPVTGS